MKRVILFFVLIFTLTASLIFFISKKENQEFITPLANKLTEKSLDKYTFENLRKKEFKPSEITIGKVIKQGTDFISYMFYFQDQGKKISGLMNLPKKAGTYPLIVMFRGFVPKKKYSEGEGTRASAEYFANNGFITLAPDFLGYGESASSSANSIEERFQTYSTAITLLNSVKSNLNPALEKIQCKDLTNNNKFEARIPKLETISNDKNHNSQNSFENLKIRILSLFRISDFGFRAFAQNNNKAVEKTNQCKNIIQANIDKVGIWGHSNGGHIALSVMAITGKNYPTVLWAPVSKPFPYSILFFTDEYQDNGKALRKAVANFEKDYDAEKYSPTNFYKWINAPIELHQGTADESVPQRWSDTLSQTLKTLGKDITYYTYPGENHNFQNGNWTTAIQRSTEFYKETFK